MRDEKTPQVTSHPVPSIDEQIRFIRKDRKALENGLTLLDGPEHVAEYEVEILMLRSIEENLIAVKMLNAADQAAGPNAPEKILGLINLDSEGKPVSITPIESPETETMKEWPTTGDSVALRIVTGSTHEWVDAYVVRPIPNGVEVKTYWGRLVNVTDLSLLRVGSVEVKTEVCNG